MISLIGASTTRATRRRLATTATELMKNPGYCRGPVCLFHSSPGWMQNAKEGAPMRRKKHELSEEQKEKVEKIFQKVLWLDTIEVHLVTELVNQKLGLILSPKERAALQKIVDGQTVGGASADGGAKEAEKEEAPSTVDLKLAGFDEKSKIKVIKEVRAIAGLGLKEAKELVESAPKVIQKGLKPEQAEELKQKLEAAGAQIELV